MNVGLVSDTHMPRFGRRLPVALRRGLVEAKVELILHLGDFTSPDVPALFEEIAPLDGVAGNNDPPQLVERFGLRKVLDVGGVNIGLLHGHAIARHEPGHTLDRVLASFPGERLAAVLFGHSHLAYRELREGVWFVNPGSPTDRRRSPMFSYAILEIHDGTIVPELRTYRDRSTA